MTNLLRTRTHTRAFIMRTRAYGNAPRIYNNCCYSVLCQIYYHRGQAQDAANLCSVNLYVCDFSL